jgi:hypothetical protein
LKQTLKLFLVGDSDSNSFFEGDREQGVPPAQWRASPAHFPTTLTDPPCGCGFFSCLGFAGNAAAFLALDRFFARVFFTLPYHLAATALNTDGVSCFV